MFTAHSWVTVKYMAGSMLNCMGSQNFGGLNIFSGGVVNCHKTSPYCITMPNWSFIKGQTE